MLVLGAVAYDPKVVTIWEGFKAWFGQNDLPFDYVLYSNYERMVEDLVSARLDVAWNSPLAWIRARRLAQRSGFQARALAMRDTDRDLTSVIVVRADSGLQKVADLTGKRIGVGAVDSPQATLLPLALLRAEGVSPRDGCEVRLFDVLAGKHGDHIGGERMAAEALVGGEVDAACMIDGNHLAFGREGTLPAGTTRILAQTAPYDHCNFTTLDRTPVLERFTELLLGMSPADPALRGLFELEGLNRWEEGRTSGYAALEAAVDQTGFYDAHGAITPADYRY
jgi:phosphonate transport system substrate-binding protein